MGTNIHTPPNLGHLACVPGGVWARGLAKCGDNKLSTLSTVWKKHLEVCYACS